MSMNDHVTIKDPVETFSVSEAPSFITATNSTFVGRGCRTYGSVDSVFLYGDYLTSEKSNEVKVGDTIKGQKIPLSVKLLVRAFPRTVEWVLRNVLN